MSSRLFRERTAEERAAFRQEMLDERASLTVAYQLGWYVGEQIVDKFLPTLNVDMCTTRRVTAVTPEEETECKRLDELWFSKRMASENRGKTDNSECEDEWKALRAYHEMLEAKYLPSTLECNFQLLNITPENMKEFKDGLSNSLWDCDRSHYSTNVDDIIVQADADGWYTSIILKRA